jgi:hypothetical protein
VCQETIPREREVQLQRERVSIELERRNFRQIGTSNFRGSFRGSGRNDGRNTRLSSDR